MQWNVKIIKGAFAGMFGTAIPARAVGPLDARVFLVLVTIVGVGTLEYPVDAVEEVKQ
jgi:hypothetical protein